MIKIIETFRDIWNPIPNVAKAIIIIALLFYPIGIIHEFGHYLVGINQNSSCVIYWWLETHCEPDPQNWVYWIMGGIFGMIGSSVLIGLRIVRKTRWFWTGVINILFTHFIFAIFEAFAHPLYLHSFIFSSFMAGLIIIFMFSSLRPLMQRSKKIT